VEKAEDYRWSSARAHVLGMVDEILSTQSWLTDTDLNGYRDFIRHEDKNVEDSIRKATSIGRPFGDEIFIKTIGTILNRDITPRDAGRPRKQNEK
jgi:putative transposase